VLKLAQEQEVIIFKWSDVFDTRDVRGHSLQQSASLQSLFLVQRHIGQPVAGHRRFSTNTRCSHRTTCGAAWNFANLNTGCIKPHIAIAVLTPIGFGSAKSQATKLCRLRKDKRAFSAAGCRFIADVQPRFVQNKLRLSSE
jgi:hypothetical protein